MSNTIYNNQIKVSCQLVCDESGYYYLIYKTTNLKNGKIYIGKHTTKNPYDNYMGSGNLIIQAIKKYGIENFTKEILFCFTTEEDAFLKENEIVTQKFIDRDDTYNIAIGGKGITSERVRGENNPMYGVHRYGEKNPMYGRRGENSPNYGKHHTQETRDKISKIKIGKKHSEKARENISKNHADVSGEKNPMYGKRGENSPVFGEKNGMYGKKHSQDARDKMSKNNVLAKAILKIDVFGDIVAEYSCMKKCCVQEHICREKLKRIIKKHILYNSFYFEYKPKN